ncbi:MAG: dihydrodipicolinate synthase family protein, partial [Armatimonadetes bacterium]|nr:dihydrodipicolinate synthase family protein [Armatimonadota bacterium]
MPEPTRGIIPALATPLREDGSVDVHGMGRLIEYVVGGGVAGIFVLSSTGEGPMLRETDKATAVKTAVEAVAGRVAVFVHIADTSTARVISQAERAAELGADCAVATLPFYFRHSGSQVLSFYTDVADASPLPVLIYNVPVCTGVQITADQVAELAAHPNIVGIKESTLDWRQFQRIV